MSVAKIIELTATSSESFEDACRQGLEKAGRRSARSREPGSTVRRSVEDGKVHFHVHLKVTFVLE